MKFIRSYRLSVEVGPFVPDFSGAYESYATRIVDIPADTTDLALTGDTPPLTCEFEIRREYLASAQTGTFVIYNLGRLVRNLIYKDQYNTGAFAAVQFRAGYVSQDNPGGLLPLLFNGSLRWAYSDRPGRDFKTTIDAFDFGFAYTNSFTARTFAAGSTLAETLAILSTDIAGVTASPPGTFPKAPIGPIIGNFPQLSYRGRAFFGPTMKLISDHLPQGAQATIDGGQLKILNRDEYIQITGQVPTLDAESGLLSPPVRSGQMITCKILFEPRLTIGQLVNLKSSTNEIFNGPKKVVGFRHKGTISPAVGGECFTEVQLDAGALALTPIQGTIPV